jgi:kumamolisin
MPAARLNERIDVSLIVRSRWWARLPSDAEFVTQLTGKPLAERSHLDVKEYLDTYKADKKDLADVKKWAEGAGLEVVPNRHERERRRVVVRGSIRAMAKAFRTTLAIYETRNGQRRRLRTDPIFVPDHLADVIEGVFGLSDLRLGRFRQRVAPGPDRPRTSAKEPICYRPQDFAEMYNFPPGDGNGQTIAILEFGGGYERRKLVRNFELIDIHPAPKVFAVRVNGAANNPGLSPLQDLEVTLDLMVIGAIVPRAKIRVYFAPNNHQGWVDALTQAVLHEETSVISISWGDIEGRFDEQAITQIERALKVAALRGITVCCASGDHGTTDGVNFQGGLAHVWYPASSPYVLSCGGTRVTVKEGRIHEERVWNDGLHGVGSATGPVFWATGGGMSERRPVPIWQGEATKATVSVNSGLPGRGVPDVAGNAAKLWNLGSHIAGGTSAVAPLWAALIAKLNQRLGEGKRAGLLNPLLYKVESGFNRVTIGSNDDVGTSPGYSAGYRSWNACTGLGSPNGEELLAALGYPSATKTVPKSP